MLSRLKRLAPALKDLLRLLGYAVGYIPALILPARFDAWFIDHATSSLFRLRPGKLSKFAEKMVETLGDQTPSRDPIQEAEGHYQMLLEGPWARVRNLRKHGWKPKITVEGLEHLEASRAAGSGTVLWRMPFGSSLTVKAGLWQHGVPLVHLSEEHHGASAPIWTSTKVLCPLFRRAENWYLAERIIIPKDGSTVGIMKTLLDRLKNQNAVVSIVAFRLGTQSLWTPFFDGCVGLAIGSPALAWRAGSSLLPVYAAREGTGRFRVVIEEPIEVDRSVDRKVFLRQATDEFTARMQNAIQRYPGSWGKWGMFWSQSGPFWDPCSHLPRSAD